jgi:hypothetical protein
VLFGKFFKPRGKYSAPAAGQIYIKSTATLLNVLVLQTIERKYWQARVVIPVNNNQNLTVN